MKRATSEIWCRNGDSPMLKFGVEKVMICECNFRFGVANAIIPRRPKPLPANLSCVIRWNAQPNRRIYAEARCPVPQGPSIPGQTTLHQC
eukprot:1183263-Prorocentrum_minimum.AAC.2